jgi:GNAT superfamily N-acetyltransferase
VSRASEAALEVRRIEDRPALEELLALRWSGASILVRGRFVEPSQVEAFGAYQGEALAGLVTWRYEGRILYLLTLDNVTGRRGVGERLLDAVIEQGRADRAPLLRALIGNDNVNALGFYQRRGFRIVAVHTGAVDVMRAYKPSIPEIGLNGIPLHDEIELELAL